MHPLRLIVSELLPLANSKVERPVAPFFAPTQNKIRQHKRSLKFGSSLLVADRVGSALRSPQWIGDRHLDLIFFPFLRSCVLRSELQLQVHEVFWILHCESVDQHRPCESPAKTDSRGTGQRLGNN